ncbi:hypothetical protein MO867_10480 [Microbulbifer sp. OS29]|uniref:Uncharacterized protein n=1 Tax=Microbulbifer okhotskensis TaxID=2926617 RepID=A0A9X2ENB6_9GAMM|nr:hypothetical protein [Microbulbifer okhotskensis]MCO1334765.1 hypothetical protein [Microbulbifer okhotskensis]
MDKIHIALSTTQIEESVKDYTQRLSCAPCIHVLNEFALWRTETINLSIRNDPGSQTGTLRHLGWESNRTQTFSSDTDVNGILWESFNAQLQAEEINKAWSTANYHPKSN